MRCIDVAKKLEIFAIAINALASLDHTICDEHELSHVLHNPIAFSYLIFYYYICDMNRSHRTKYHISLVFHSHSIVGNMWFMWCRVHAAAIIHRFITIKINPIELCKKKKRNFFATHSASSDRRPSPTKRPEYTRYSYAWICLIFQMIVRRLGYRYTMAFTNVLLVTVK